MDDPSLKVYHTLQSGSLGGAEGGVKLEKELVLGFELDHKRKAEDEMKKRAIRTAGSYDEFRNLVAVATQKPVTQSDYGSKAVTSVNRALPGESVRAVGSLGLGLELPGGGAEASSLASSSATGMGGSIPTPEGFGLPPGSPGEFDRVWRRLGPGRRGAFLQWLGPQRLGHPFRRDIDGSMLGALVGVIGGGDLEVWEGLSGKDAVLQRLDLMRGILETTPPSSLGLAVDLLSKEEGMVAKTLHQASVTHGHHSALFERLLS